MFPHLSFLALYVYTDWTKSPFLKWKPLFPILPISASSSDIIRFFYANTNHIQTTRTRLLNSIQHRSIFLPFWNQIDSNLGSIQTLALMIWCTIATVKSIFLMVGSGKWTTDDDVCRVVCVCIETVDCGWIYGNIWILRCHGNKNNEISGEFDLIWIDKRLFEYFYCGKLLKWNLRLSVFVIIIEYFFLFKAKSREGRHSLFVALIEKLWINFIFFHKFKIF